MLRWCLVTLLFLTTSAQVIGGDSFGGEPNIQGGAGGIHGGISHEPFIQEGGINGHISQEPFIQGGAGEIQNGWYIEQWRENEKRCSGEVEITFLEIILEAQVENVQHFYEDFSKNNTDSEEILGGKCGRIKRVYCVGHGLYLLHNIYQMCKIDVSCWIDELKKIKNDEERSGNCWSDCYNFICKKIKNKLEKFFKLFLVDKDLSAIDCPDNPSQE